MSTYAPQYLQLELTGVYNIAQVCLFVSQLSSGLTSHLLFFGPWLNSTQLVNNMTGVTNTLQWINLTYSPPLDNVRFRRLSTSMSPSWVSWFKFLVYGV